MRAGLLVSLVLWGCSPPPEATEVTPVEQPVLERLPEDVLVGEWRVAGIDGEALEEKYGIALTADEREIWWEPRCAGAIIPYRVEGSRFRIVSSPPPADVPPASTAQLPPVCAVGPPPRLFEVMRALREGELIERTPENGLRISGPEHSVTLFSQ